MATLSVPALFSDYPFQVQVDQHPGKISFKTVVPTRSLRFSEVVGLIAELLQQSALDAPEAADIAVVHEGKAAHMKGWQFSRLLPRTAN
ncbi:MAG: hypothetical protein V3T83_09185 [Acidobacteriota bacterium]